MFNGNNGGSSTDPRRWHQSSDVIGIQIFIENVRVDGKPAQRHITILAASLEKDPSSQKPAHSLWNGVEQKLAVLNFSAKERNAIVEVIPKRVPRVTDQAISTTCPDISKANGKHRGQAA